MPDKDDYLRIGIITRTHGLKGDLMIFPTSDMPNRFENLDECMVFAGNGQVKKLHPKAVRYFKKFVIVEFEEFNDINEAEPFVKRDVWVDRANAMKLEPGEYFICDLLGHKVVTYKGEEVGELVDILTTGANNVYVIEMADGKELLVPVIPESKIEHDMDAGVTRIELMKGLL